MSTSFQCTAEGTHDDSLGFDYDVFLNFCGQDTRHGIVDALYEKLKFAGISTFKDDEKLRKGDEIKKLLQIVEQSKISIPIFSVNYASREWCLHELVQMVECWKGGAQKILPIFYHIEPSVVKEQRGAYGKAFLEHEKKVAEETVEKWRKALTEVGSNISGWVYKEEKDGYVIIVVVVLLHVNSFSNRDTNAI